ncbi:MAG: hypothetical protein WCI21_03865, partial [Alphaproteobacteria bacterium]
MNCDVFSSVSFIDMSRLTLITWSFFSENAVPNTRSEWASIAMTCLPSATWMARTRLSKVPNESSVPSSLKQAPYKVSTPTVSDRINSIFATSQNWISPNSEGAPPAAASAFPSGEKRIDVIFGERPTKRPT